MATASLVPKASTSVYVNDEVAGLRRLLVDNLMPIIIYDGKPVTFWEIVTKLEEGYIEQASAIFDELTAEGTLARFRAGFINYYASPRVVLTQKGPALRTIILDSLKSLFLSCRYKVMGKIK